MNVEKEREEALAEIHNYKKAIAALDDESLELIKNSQLLNFACVKFQVLNAIWKDQHPTEKEFEPVVNVVRDEETVVGSKPNEVKTKRRKKK